MACGNFWVILQFLIKDISIWYCDSVVFVRGAFRRNNVEVGDCWTKGEEEGGKKGVFSEGGGQEK